MPDLAKLAKRSTDSSSAAPTVSAVIERPPADVNDEMAVIVPSFDAERLYEVRHWMPRGVQLPAKGDAALIAFAEPKGEPWLVAYGAEVNSAPAGGGISQAELDAAIATRQAAAEKNTANGYAGLGADAKLPTSLIPALATTEVYTVATQAAQLALVAQRGDVAVRTDQHKSYIHNGGSAATMADWTVLDTPIDAVTAVNGQIGTVNLGASDVGAAAVNHAHTTKSDLPAPTAYEDEANTFSAAQTIDIDTFTSKETLFQLRHGSNNSAMTIQGLTVDDTNSPFTIKTANSFDFVVDTTSALSLNADGSTTIGGALTVQGKQVRGTPKVTALPTSPVDGEEVYFDTGTLGIMWHLRYNAASASTHRWEFLGGGALRDDDTSIQTKTSTAFADYGFNLPLPLSGVYRVHLDAQAVIYDTGSVLMGPASANTAITLDSQAAYVSLAAGERAQLVRERTLDVSAGATAVTTTYRITGASQRIRGVRLSATPERVS